MKNTVRILTITVMLSVFAQADFLMTLTDKNGVEENLCVKSYSFSNNLESLHKQQNQSIDDYSTQETLTNKRYLGKPVYRIVVPMADFSIPPNGQYVKITSDKTFNDIDEVVALEHFGRRQWSDTNHSMSSTNSMQIVNPQGLIYTQSSYFDYDTKKIVGNFGMSMINFSLYVTKFKFIMEYTKTTDNSISNESQLSTLINYLPSNSTTGEYQVKSLDDMGVRILKNYTYDSVTDNCIAPSN